MTLKPRGLFIVMMSVFMGQASFAKFCDKTIYLTFDTGNMAVAHTVSEILKKHEVKATFFLANEKTMRGDFSLDDSWKTYWQDLVRQGHRFGSHTIDHTYWQKDVGQYSVRVKSQFGPNAGKAYDLNSEQMCRQIQAVDRRFQELTGVQLNPIWRAPGGKVSPRLIEMGKQCKYRHIAWAQAGFLGDELPSNKYPNDRLLANALRDLKDGDITMAHLGIWSRKDPWAPAALEPLILGLKQKGFCFGTIDS